MPYSDPERRREYRREHYLRNMDLYKDRAAKQRAQPGHKEYIDPIKRRSLLKQRYGITPEDYDEMLAKQAGCCAACKSTTPGNGKGERYFDIDHDHATGKVRGLLCRRCNVMAGTLEQYERVELVRAYLESHKG